MSVTGDGDGHATAAGTPVVDHHGAALLAMGVLAAYVRRLVTGQGTRVQSSLLAAGLDLQAESLALYYSGGKSRADIRRPGALATWFIDPPYGIYRLRDAHAAIALSGTMDDFAAALGSTELAAFDQRARRDHREQYTRILELTLAAWTYQELAARLEPLGFWIERVADYDDVREDAQVAEEGLLMDIPVGDARATVLSHPVRYDGALPPLRTPPPRLGEHTRPLLREAGFGVAEIDELIGSRVVIADDEAARG